MIRDRPLNDEETTLSQTRRYRKFTARQKLELVMANLRGERSIAELCREHRISESLLRRWRERALEAASKRFADGEQRSQGGRAAAADRRAGTGSGRKTYELEVAGELLAGWE